ncbi:MAG: sigma 54-interacting transcriptional regulator [Gammaproteobacteria bacterium]|nr:sigma 54-interacting transcriptional regulator [Gammaproteobacteria bacterium]
MANLHPQTQWVRNSGALPASLKGNKLFGHERGGFTGAWYQPQDHVQQGSSAIRRIDPGALD